MRAPVTVKDKRISEHKWIMKKLSKDAIEKELIAIVTQLLAESGEPYKRQIKLESSMQRHLGIDSLGRAELFHRVEKTFDVTLPDRFLAEAETLQDIANYLEETAPTIKQVTPSSIVTFHGEKSTVDPLKADDLISLLFLYAEKSPNKPHIFFQTEEGKQEIITYETLLTSALRVAQSLKMLGLKEGDTVAIMQPTSPGFFYIFFGTLLAGGIPVPIYPPFRMHMLEAYAKTEARILSNAEVRILVTFTEAENFSRLLKTFVPSLIHVTTVEELLAPPVLKTPFRAKAEDIGFIQYTSGSTADPKGVVLTHANLLTNIRAYGKAIKVTPDDITVSWLPLYHDMGLIGMWLGSLYFGVPLVLLTPFSFLNHPERWFWAIHYHRGTLSGAPNFAYELCVRKIDPEMLEGLDLSSWRMAANGAEKVYPRTLEQFATKFAPYGFKRNALLPVYGLAESTVGLAIPPIGREFKIDHVDRKQFELHRKAVPSTTKNALEFVACGYPIEGHEIRIVDDEQQVLSERTVGNLQFRGPSSMQGYYRNPKATKAVFHDGWLDSGDLAYLADGEVYITGRRKDLIIKAGRNIYPAEIEEVVSSVAGVRQGCVAAFGAELMRQNKQMTEQLIVVAETREKQKDKREQIVENVRDVVSSTLDIVPDEVILVAPHIVPKTSSGKLQRAACKKMFIEGKLGKKQKPAWMQIGELGVRGFFLKVTSFVKRILEFIYTSYVGLWLLITLPFVYLFVRFSDRTRAAWICRVWCHFIRIVSFCPMKVVGSKNLTKHVPVIYAANHSSYIDTILLLSVVPPTTRFIGKKELTRVPILRTFMRKLDFLAVDRLDLPRGIEDTKRFETVLKSGHPILIFPEGTFGYAAGLRPFRLGAFKVAAETAVEVCPIALKGTRHILRDNEKLLRPGRVVMTIGEPIAPKGSEWQDVTQLRSEVREEIAKYCGEPSLDYIAAEIVAPRLPKQ